MGRGRNGVLIQNPQKHRKSVATNINNENCVVYNRKTFVRKEEDFFLDPYFIDFLCSLNPREVAQTLTKG